jgi:signal peptidase I
MRAGSGPGRPSGRRRIRRWVLALAGAAALLAAVRSSVAGIYRVHGDSDAPTILAGDRVVAILAAYDLRLPFTSWRILHRSDPRPGEMVLFRVPEETHVAFKRVVAGPGDTVELRGSRLVLNGREAAYEPLDLEEMAWVPPAGATGVHVEMEDAGSFRHPVTYTPGASPPAGAPPVTVPEDHYFLLGDNRDRSRDSRSFGPLPRSAVLGRLAGDHTAPRRR